MTADPVPDRLTTAADVLRLSTPAGLLAAVPGLLGFTPSNSVVVLALSGRRVGVTMRVDLPEPAADERPMIDDVVPRVLRAAPHADQAVVVVYPAEAAGHRDLLPWRGFVGELADALEAGGLELRDALCVSGDRWFSYLCDDDECCSPQGAPLEGSDALRVRSGLALAGVAPLPDRAALVAEVAPTFGPVRHTVADLVDERSTALVDRLGLAASTEATQEAPAELARALESWRDEAIDTVAAVLRGGRADESETADVLLALADVRVRDTVLWDLMAEDSPALWDHAATTLAQATRRAPDGAVAPVATVLAIARWQHGDGVRARVALDRALADEPGYSLALLVMQALDRGLPPQEWRAMMASLARDECRFGSTRSTPRRRRRRRRGQG